jgi:RNA polymerase sigma-70 factor (ECF subfamily)
MGEIGAEGPTRMWLTQAQEGNQQGFSELYEHIAPSLHTWAHLRIRPEQSAHLDPADLVQEVWLRAWRQMDSFEGDGAYFRFWIFRIAKNVLLEAVRRGQKSKGAGGPTTRLNRAHAQVDHATAISQRLARDESLDLFREQVAKLPEDERKLVLHCGLEGLPHAQVAERLGLSVEAVTKRWQRLRSRLAHSELPLYLLA